MFLVVTLLNLVKSLGNKKNKPLALFPVGADCKRGQNVQWSVILDKCAEIFSTKYRRSALFFNALSLCFDFSSFQTAHRNKNKLRTN